MDNSFWVKNAHDVARALVGKTLVVGTNQVVVRKAEGFLRETNTKGVYRPVLEMQPGQVYCPKLMASILLLIVTEGGGCVLVRAVQVGDETFDGPGKVTKRLGLTTPRLPGETRWVNDTTISIHALGESRPPG